MFLWHICLILKFKTPIIKDTVLKFKYIHIMNWTGIIINTNVYVVSGVFSLFPYNIKFILVIKMWFQLLKCVKISFQMKTGIPLFIINSNKLRWWQALLKKEKSSESSLHLKLCVSVIKYYDLHATLNRRCVPLWLKWKKRSHFFLFFPVVLAIGLKTSYMQPEAFTWTTSPAL
jgi:hypothetical protein